MPQSSDPAPYKHMKRGLITLCTTTCAQTQECGATNQIIPFVIKTLFANYKHKIFDLWSCWVPNTEDLL